ncbi:hypothetical protein ACFLTS_04365 [Chloroflexota bacterium]
MTDEGLQPVQVRCYSGHTYAERPSSFILDSIEQTVRIIEKEWREPGEKRFRVRTEDDRIFNLRYNEQKDNWSAVEIIGG